MSDCGTSWRAAEGDTTTAYQVPTHSLGCLDAAQWGVARLCDDGSVGGVGMYCHTCCTTPETVYHHVLLGKSTSRSPNTQSGTFSRAHGACVHVSGRVPVEQGVVMEGGPTRDGQLYFTMHLPLQYADSFVMYTPGHNSMLCSEP